MQAGGLRLSNLSQAMKQRAIFLRPHDWLVGAAARIIRVAAAIFPELAPDGHACGWMFGGRWRVGSERVVGYRNADRSAGSLRATIGRIHHPVEGLSLVLPGRSQGAKNGRLSADSQHARLHDRFQLPHFRGIPQKSSWSQYAPQV